MYFLLSLLLFFHSFNLSPTELIPLTAWKAGPPAAKHYTNKDFPTYSFTQGDLVSQMTYSLPPLESLIEKVISDDGTQENFSEFKNELKGNFRNWVNSLQALTVPAALIEPGENAPLVILPMEKYLGTGQQVRYNLKGERDENGPVFDSRIEPDSTLNMPSLATTLLRDYQENTRTLIPVIRSTAFFISPNILLTTAHSGYNHPNTPNPTTPSKWSALVAIAAANKNIHPFGMQDVDQMFIPQAYFQRTDTTAPLDVGIIILSKPLGLFTGCFGIASFSHPEFLLNKHVYVGGYPATLGAYSDEEEAKFPNNQGIVLKDHRYMGISGAVTSVENRSINYNIDTSRGQSGAPISINDPATLGNSHIAIGIHNKAAVIEEANKGTLFYPALFNTIIDIAKKHQLKKLSHPLSINRADFKSFLQYSITVGKEILGSIPSSATAAPNPNAYVTQQLSILQTKLTRLLPPPTTSLSLNSMSSLCVGRRKQRASTYQAVDDGYRAEILETLGDLLRSFLRSR